MIRESVRGQDSVAQVAQQAEMIRDAWIYQEWNQSKELGRLCAQTLEI
jgi:hypothetical protein